MYCIKYLLAVSIRSKPVCWTPPNLSSLQGLQKLQSNFIRDGAVALKLALGA